MITERNFYAVSPQLLLADGGQYGELVVPNALAFKVGQTICLRSNTVPYIEFKVNRIISPTQMLLGVKGKPVSDRVDLRVFLMADSAVALSYEQPRPAVPLDQINRAVYEEEPVVAIRSFLVDQMGNGYTAANPLPVNIGTTLNIDNINVQLSAVTKPGNNPPDSVRVGDGTNEVAVNPDGSVNVKVLNGSQFSIGTEDGTQTGTPHVLKVDSNLDLHVTDPNLTAKLPSSIGQKPMSDSLSVTLASDQPAIPVVLTNSSDQSYDIVNYFNEITGVNSNSETIIVSKTNTLSTPTYLTQIDFDGTNIAEYRIYINSNLVAKKRTYFGSSLNGTIDFAATGSELGLELNPGDTLYLKVIHFRPSVADFSGNLFFIESYSGSTNVLNYYAEITSIASSTQTDIIDFTVPSTGSFKLLKIEASGTNIAQYELYIGSTKIAKKNTYFGGELNVLFDFTSQNKSGFAVGNTIVVSLKVIHSRPNTGDFNATLLYVVN